MKIACVGDNCVDYYDNTGEVFPGGNPVNVAVYVRRMGGQSAYLGAVGSDEYGGLILRALEEKGVDVRRVKRLPGATALSHVCLIDGERVFGDYDEGVMAQFVLAPGDVEFLCSHDLVVSGLWGRVEKSLAQIAARGVPVAFDCAERPEDEAAQIALPHTTLAFFSDDASDLERLKERLTAVAALGPRVVVATRGEKGSVAFDGAAFHTQGVLPCVVKDTMGAGDSYIAGFVMEYLRGKDIPACMAAGAASSAVTLGYVGAW